MEGRPAVNTLLQCTPLLVEKACVAANVALRFTMCKQVEMQIREIPYFKTHGEDHTESIIGVISGLAK